MNLCKWTSIKSIGIAAEAKLATLSGFRKAEPFRTEGGKAARFTQTSS
ncbi:MAG TPA: hypothetical protein VGW76_03650 [Pyrinomonadaceae bacterium]|nr:hypothetical protein [Pyrinomonadaceae bacterium]